MKNVYSFVYILSILIFLSVINALFLYVILGDLRYAKDSDINEWGTFRVLLALVSFGITIGCSYFKKFFVLRIGVGKYVEILATVFVSGSMLLELFLIWYPPIYHGAETNVYGSLFFISAVMILPHWTLIPYTNHDDRY